MIRKLKSPAWAVLEYGWYPLLGFLTTPYFLHTLGAEKFAHWVLLTTTVGVGGILSAGTGAATIKYISAARGMDDVAEVETTIQASLAVAVVLGGALALVTFAAFWIGGDVMFRNMGDGDLIRLTGAAAAVLICIEQLENVFASALKGAELFGVAARLEIASKTAQIVSALVVLHVTGNFTAFYGALVAVGVARLAAKAWAAKRSLRLSSLRPRFSNLAKVLRFAKWGWLQGLSGMLFGIVDRILVGSILGAVSLAHYAVVIQLVQQIHGVPAAAMSVIFPKVSRRLEADGRFSLWRLTRTTVLVCVAVSSTLALGMWLFGLDMLRLWLGAGVAASGKPILASLIIAYWLLSLTIVPYFLLLALGQIRFVGLAILSAGVAAVIGLYVATVTWGYTGIPLGRIIYALGTFALLVPLVRRLRDRQQTTLQTERESRQP